MTFSAYIYNPPNAVFASYLVRLKIGPLADSKFIAYFLKSPQYWEYVHGVLGDKSAQPNASAKTLAQAKVNLPPLPEQRAIAAILGALDDKIELNRRMNHTLEQIAQTIFKSWFVDFDPVRANRDGEALPGLAPEVQALFPNAFEDSALGEVPQGWRVGKLGQVMENPRRGVEPSSINPDTPYIGLEHMPRRSIALDEWGRAEDVGSTKLAFFDNEILFGKLRPYFHKVGVAPVDGVASSDIIVISCEPTWFGFVLGHVSSVQFVEYANGVSTGTKMPRASWADMTKYTVAIPPPDLALRHAGFVQPIVQRVKANIMEVRSLSSIRDTLLPKLLSGEIRVRDAEAIVEEQL